MIEKLPPPSSNLSPPHQLPPIDTEGASTYHISISQVPLEFGGTLKSSKGSKNGSNQHSPQKKSRSSSGTSGNGSSKAENQNQCGYCACFGCCGYGSRHRIAMPFWPALLANLGICALLVGYIFIGSFVFLTIENSNDRDVRLESNAADSWHTNNFAQMQQKFQQQSHQHHMQQQQQHQQQHQQQQQQQHQYSSQQRQSESGRNSTAFHLNTRRKRANNHLAKSTTTSSFTPEVSTHIKSMKADDKKQNSIVAFSPPSSVGARGRTSLEYDLQALPIVDEVEANNNEAEDYVGDDGSVSAYEDATLVDGERQRTVENIWDITVSLNILYKENWTRLAALEIAKFQDQLVKRLVMDLTVSTANGATQSSATAARGRNNKQQQQNYQIDGVNVNKGLAVGLGNYERQRFWQPENIRHQNNRRNSDVQRGKREAFEWNFPTAFLYSMTVITTVGYGTITPRTNLGRMVTIGYATIGIPLTLIYLSSIGSVLSTLLRYCFTRTSYGVCCCIRKQSNRRQTSIGSSSIFNRHPQVADRKTELKLKHFQQPQQQQPLPYCYVRPPAEMEIQPHQPTQQQQIQQQQQQIQQQQHQIQQQHNISGGSAFDNLSSNVTSVSETSRHGKVTTVLTWNLAAPIGLCTLLLVAYIAFGAIVMALLENWPLIDGVYFCFMSLSTIGFCDLLPGVSDNRRTATTANIAIWFCAVYILSGLTLTSLCVNLLHDEITARMRVVVKFEKVQDEKHESGYCNARS